MQALIIRNNELVSLLQKSKLVVPPFIGPKLLSCIVTIHKDDEEIVPVEISQEKSKPENSKKKSENTRRKSNTKKSSNEKLPETPINDTTKQNESHEATTIGGIELIPVYDVNSVKKNTEPVKNSVEIHPVISNEATIATPVTATMILAKDSTETKTKNLKKDKVNIEQKTVNDNRTSKSKKRKIESDKNEIAVKSQRKSKEINKLFKEIPKVINKPITIATKVKTPEIKSTCDNIDKVNKMHDTLTKITSIEQNCENSSEIEINNSNVNLRVEIDNSNLQDISTFGPPELGSDVLANLNMGPNDLNPASLSPTAAFLQSFPVVSTTASKPSEIESNYSTTTNLLQITDKTNQQSEQSLFENITSLFSAENSPPAKVANECSAALLSGLENSKNSNASKGKDFKVQTQNNIEKSSTTSNENKSIYKPPDFSFSFAFPSTTSIVSSATTSTSSSMTSANTVQCNNPFDFYESLSSIGVSNNKNQSSGKKSSNYAITNLTDSKGSNQIVTPVANNIIGNATTSSLSSNPINSLASFGPKHSNSDATTKKTPIKHSISERFIGNSTSTTITSNSISFNPYPIESLPTPSLPMNFPFYHPPVSSGSTASFNQSVTSANIAATNCAPYNNNYSDATAHGHHQNLGYTNSHNFDFLPEKPLISTEVKLSSSNSKCIENEKKSLPTTKSLKHMTDKSSRNTSKSHVNWMTSPTSNYQKQIPSDTISSLAYNPTTTYNASHYQAPQDDNLPWSPNRMIDTSNFTPTAILPNLNGDLALNTINSTFSASSGNGQAIKEQKTNPDRASDRSTNSNIVDKKHKSYQQTTQIQSQSQIQSQAQSQSQYQNQSQSYSHSQIENTNNISNNSFLSVSQLVEHQQRHHNSTASMPDVKKSKTKEYSTNSKSKNSKNISNSNSNIFTSNCSIGNGISNDSQKPQTYSNSYSAEALISSTSTNPINTFNDNEHSKRLKTLNSYPQTSATSNIDYFGSTGTGNGPDYGSTLPTDVYTPYYSSVQSQQSYDNDFFSSSMAYGCNPSSNNIPMPQLSTYAPPQFQHYPPQDTQSDFSSRRNYTSNNFPTSTVSSIKSSAHNRSIPAPPFVLPMFTDSTTSKSHSNSKNSIDTNRSQINNLNSNDKLNQPSLPLHLSTSTLSNNCAYRPPLFSSTTIDVGCSSTPALKPIHYSSSNSVVNNCTNQNYNGNENISYSGNLGSNTNAITNFNLTTICPEIGHDKRRQTQNW